MTGLSQGLKIRGGSLYCGGHNLLPLVEIGLATAPQPPSCNGPEVCGAINTSVCILGQGGRGEHGPPYFARKFNINLYQPPEANYTLTFLSAPP